MLVSPASFRAQYLHGARDGYMSESGGIHIRKKSYFLLEIQYGILSIFFLSIKLFAVESLGEKKNKEKNQDFVFWVA